INRRLSSRVMLWIASELGLWLLPDASAARLPDAGGRGGIRPLLAPGSEAQPGLRGRVVDVRPVGDALYVITQDALYRWDAAGWAGPLREGVQVLGRLYALATADGQLWVAGDGGVARFDLDAQLWTSYLRPMDIPETPVVDVLPAGADVWLATPAGALRLRWRT